MFSKILLNKSNIIYNARTLSQIAEAKLCVMVKANGYGHGAREVVEMLGDEVDCFGVSNQYEAIDLREMTEKEIIVFGRCEDYSLCIENDISFSLFNFEHLKEILKSRKQNSLSPKMHLCLNTGMNRYGVREKKEFEKILNLLIKEKIELCGIYTHFSSLTTDREYTQTQYQKFQEFCQMLPKEWKTTRHLGGGKSLFEDFDADMFRVGLEIYGYGDPLLKPVLSVESEIVSIQEGKAGEHVGYLCGYTTEKDVKIATIPLGYGDGLPRKLSNKLKVQINGKERLNIGNICMDAFMVNVDKLRCKVGDKVCLFYNISEIAKELETTEYEVLTNLSKFRGERIIF